MHAAIKIGAAAHTNRGLGAVDIAKKGRIPGKIGSSAVDEDVEVVGIERRIKKTVPGNVQVLVYVDVDLALYDDLGISAQVYVVKVVIACRQRECLVPAQRQVF
jgi:hypothetical protein